MPVHFVYGIPYYHNDWRFLIYRPSGFIPGITIAKSTIYISRDIAGFFVFRAKISFLTFFLGRSSKIPVVDLNLVRALPSYL